MGWVGRWLWVGLANAWQVDGMSAGLAESPQDFLCSSHWQAKTSSGRNSMTAHAKDSNMAICAAAFLLQYNVT